MSIDPKLMEAEVYREDANKNFTTYRIKVYCMQFGFYINGMKVIMYDMSGEYKVYKPSTLDSVTRKYVSHIEYPTDSEFAKALSEACVESLEDYLEMDIDRNKHCV